MKSDIENVKFATALQSDLNIASWLYKVIKDIACLAAYRSQAVESSTIFSIGRHCIVRHLRYMGSSGS